MKVLVWQWGRRGAGPRIAAELAAALRQVPGVRVVLSLATGAEIMRGQSPPVCELPVRTYDGAGGFLGRMLRLPFDAGALAARLREFAPDVAICAMPAPLDLLMMRALRLVAIPSVVIVHDADPHPGDGLPFQMTLQRRQVREADALVALSAHVAARLRAQGLADGAGKRLFAATLPPLPFGPPAPPPLHHGGRLRLLSFGRLLPYKGLDLLAAALPLVRPAGTLELRVVGSGPESPELDTLRALPGVRVENRWVPEEEVGQLLAWADALVLSHREASQSGVAAAAIAAGRWVVATRVGGLVEQLSGEKRARLCEPEAVSLAAALSGLLTAPPPADMPPTDARGAWRAQAEALLRRIDAELLTPAADRAA
jgi:glycosyltransferase involved in cell wall biosynthesis